MMIQPANSRILLVDDEEGILFTLGCLLKKEGYLVDVATGSAEALGCLHSGHYDLAFVDIMLAGESGMDLLRDIKARCPATRVVMLTGCPQVETAAEAVRLGAFDYIAKPIAPATLLSVSRLALDQKKKSDEQERCRTNLDAIFRSVSDVIIMADKEGRLVQFNATAGKVCGCTPDMIGGALADISLGCNGSCRTALLEALHANAPRERACFECRPPGGAARIVTFRSTPIAGGDGAVAVIRDETPPAELGHSSKGRDRFHGIIGVSPPMERIYSLIELLADVPTTVVLHGASGTGKELVAAALHHAGARAGEPFVKVNCAALSESLLESELFGHVRGAFTGAIADKVGRFQKAHHGTLFLDEIGDISPAVQMRLLRVLQESEFERVGESRSIKVDVRIIAATNRDLAEMVRKGTFRQDLYYRLNVVRIELPSLKERSEDIGLLADHFRKGFNQQFGKTIRAFSDDVMKVFRSYAWPGNVRELEHAVEHAVILCKTDLISRVDLPQELGGFAWGDKQPLPPRAVPSPVPREKLTIAEALERSGGNKSRAASLLGVSRLTVYRHLEKFAAGRA